MSLNKFGNVNTGYDINLDIGGENLKIKNLIVTNPVPNIGVDNLTINDSLTIVCDDTSTFDLVTPNNGNNNDVLTTDGNGNTYWSPIPTPPPTGDMFYTGSTPALNKIYKAGTNDGKSAVDSSISDNGSLVDFTGLNGLISNKVAINGGSNQQYLMADGTLLSSSGNAGNANFYLYDNTNGLSVPPPANGHVSYNNATLANTTMVYISHLTRDNIDIDVYFTLVTTLDDLYLQDQNNSVNFAKFNIIGAPILLPNSYISIPVIQSAFGGNGNIAFGANHDILVSFFTNLSEVNLRLSLLETKTQNQSGVPLITSFTGDVRSDTLSLTSLTSNILLGNGTTIPQYTIAGVGLGSNLIDNGIGQNFTTKGIIAGSGITLSSVGNDIQITNSNPASSISLTNVGTNSLIASNINPTFTTKGLIAGSNITINSSATDLTINSIIPITTSVYTHIPFAIGTESTLLNSNSYFNMGMIDKNITISSIKFFITDPYISGSPMLANFGLFRGVLSTGSVLVGQASVNILTSDFNLKSVNFVAQPLQNLNFVAGEIIFVGHCFNNLAIQTFISTATGDLDTTFSVATNYTAGFPATLTTALTRVSTNIHLCCSFFS